VCASDGVRASAGHARGSASGVSGQRGQPCCNSRAVAAGLRLAPEMARVREPPPAPARVQATRRAAAPPGATAASAAGGGADGAGGADGEDGDSGGGAVARRAALVAGVQAAQAKLDATEAARLAAEAARNAALVRMRAAEAARNAALAALDAHDAGERRRARAAIARAVATSSAERAACEARFAAASTAAIAAGKPVPFRGPAADSRLGEALLNVLPIAFRHGHALELHRMRGLCGLTLRERAAPGGAVTTQYGVGELVERRAADGVRVVRLPWATLYTRERVDERGFRGGPADVMARALKQQTPAWVSEARRAPRKDAQLHGEAFAHATSLIRAAAAGDERRVRELLAAGAPLRCVDGRRWTALHHASFMGSAQVVAALLEADATGAMIDAQNSTGSTALTWASEKGHEDAVRLLLARGARQELQTDNGDTALHLAAYKGNVGIVEELCAAPGSAAAIALRNKDGNTPLALAVEHGGGSERLVAALLAADAAGAALDTQNDKGETALMWASYIGHEGAVRLLLARGARQELQNNVGMAALYCAAKKGYVGVVELLCAAPGAAASLELRTKGGNTPLAIAVRNGHAAIASVLRAHGAS
jgi:ankyrin repeat protein